MSRSRALLLVLVLSWWMLSVRPGYRSVSGARHGRDFATYYYAVAEAADGGDPYATKKLSRRARKDKTRRAVHPYFYPPPFLLSMLWALPLGLGTATKAFFWFNQVALVGVLAILYRWLRTPLLLLGFLAASFTPLTDSAKMGQANMGVLLLLVFGLWRMSGFLVGTAAMAKMSPALVLALWVAQRAWRPLLISILTAIGLSLLALPLVDAEAQWRFYTDILPGFSSGHYHGLKVRIGLPANHSIPDLFNQLWPGPDRHTLSEAAQVGSKAVSLLLLGLLCWLGRHTRDTLGTAALYAALCIAMLIIPVYTYEHHLSIALFPAAVVATALLQGRLPRGAWGLAIPAYFFVAWPLYWLRPLQKAIPALHWWLQESKFIGLVALGVLAMVAALRSPRR